ncbi:MAG: MinD/ParA family protein, partial [Lachnospiraceae bacterium]|nr:MinD/ParA family protein [Lachnospiraceae bacterium]
INSLEELSRDQITYMLHEFHVLEKMADIIIIDTGAGISHTVMEFVASSSEVLLVTTPEPTSITDAYSLLKTLNRHEAYDKNSTSIKLITNQVKDYEDGQGLYEKLDMVVSKFLDIKLEFLGIIPEDYYMHKSIIIQKPVSVSFPDADSTKSFIQIAEILLEKREKYIDEKKGLSYIFMKYLKIRRGN